MTNFKISFKLLFTIAVAVLVPIMLTLAGCKGGGGATKPDTKPIAKPKMKVDMTKPLQMYCIRNNTKIRDFDKTYKDWATDLKTVRTFTNYNIIDQLMKYDRLTMYEVRSNWAYIKTTDGIEGWAPRKFLKEWNPDDFFNVKDNILTTKKNIPLYNHPTNGKVVDKFKKGETFRVLKSNLKRLFIVSKSGKSGWANAEDLDMKKLVAKAFSMKEEAKYVLPSMKFPEKKNITRMRITGPDILDENFLVGNISNVLKRTLNALLKNGVVTNFASLNFKDKGEEEIDGQKYKWTQWYQMEFFGMFAVIRVSIPSEYLNNYEAEMYDFNPVDGKVVYFDKFKKVTKKWEKSKKDMDAIINVLLYTRDPYLRKIKEFKIKGPYDFKSTVHNSSGRKKPGAYSVNYIYKKKIHKMEIVNGGIVLHIGVAHNGVLPNMATTWILKFRKFKDKNISFYPVYYDETDEEFLKNEKYIFRPKMITLKMSKEELSEAGTTAEEIKRYYDLDREFFTTDCMGLPLYDYAIEDGEVFIPKYRRFIDKYLKKMMINGKEFKLKNKNFVGYTHDGKGGTHFVEGYHFGRYESKFFPEANVLALGYQYYQKEIYSYRIGYILVSMKGKILANYSGRSVHNLFYKDGVMVFESRSHGKMFKGVQYEY